MKEKLNHKIFLFLGVIIFLCKISIAQKEADLLIYNATIYTVDSSFSVKSAMVIDKGRIIALGKVDSLEKEFNIKQKINAKAKFIYPGFIDAHCHFLAYGKSLQECDLTGTKSWEDALSKLEEFSRHHNHKKWIIGRGWDQNDWKNKQYPINKELSRTFPDIPVLLYRIDGHAAIANQKAMDMAGTSISSSLTGGEVIIQNGNPTGVLIDNAIDLVSKYIPEPTNEDLIQYLKAAENKCAAMGITGVHDCGLDVKHVQLIQQLYNTHRLSMRMYVMLSDKKDNYDYLFSKGKIQTEQLTVNGFKLYADGALGSRGACLLQPYSDMANHYGFLLKPQAYFDSILPIIANKGLQACTHAIGDSANRMILNLYAKILKNKTDLRWRIEHAQVVNEKDINLFGVSYTIPSVQPTHATSDMYWAKDRLGNERVKNAYIYKKLLMQNGWLPLGTDFPVEDISPFKTFYAAVFRKDAKHYPKEGFQTENALTRIEALKGMTIWAAKAAFEEQLKGSLQPGKLADFIILDKDLLNCNENEVLNTKVLATFIGSKQVKY